MAGLLDAALSNPWGMLDTMLAGPLHPGGTEATAALLDRAGVGPSTRLLDVGCGAGDALSVARDRGADALGIDPEPSTDRALQGDAMALPIKGGSVDVLLAECVLCLTDLDAALAEANRVLADGGRLALSDVVVVDGDRPDVPDAAADALCLTGARSRDRLTGRVEAAGFTVADTANHHDDLLAMRDRVTDRVDYEGLLGMMGERGQRALSAIEAIEAAVEAGDISYVSLVATAQG
ncbi:class I SAM-dependent methyltransferase [Haloarcula marismortui]|uniref:Methyltransferase domain-containing protein n=1 Tax=Haloarcula marismortui ATCC 33800 TaxID=662476 RepID=M0JK93_9EURY|nr:methyltransferase domain-containing protein [Haloarcula sinaiiensis]EMA09532.1 S-adenosylmethionine-dependent methyltransferase [Haloarcula sinaiiensis ATCC 33800]QUJ74286.1 methyltransferase domain-containing protein [Haloarcula sinaiiensis ATCC 33800]